MTMDRRMFGIAAAATLSGAGADAATKPVPLIDAHIHTWDWTRPQGAAWPPHKDIPPQFRGNKWLEEQKMTPDILEKNWMFPHVAGAIACEASPWLEDNLWLLEQCGRVPFMVAAVGNLKPESSDYAEYLGRFAKNPLFAGIRYGNVWPGYDIVTQSKNPVFVDGMKRLADANLVWDMGNPRMEAFDAMLRVHDQVPHLTIVVEHLVGFHPPAGMEAAYDQKLKEFRDRGLIGKVSVPKAGADGKVSDADVAQWKKLYENFGADRTICYSFIKQPGQKNSAGYDAIRHYFDDKPRDVTDKYFWGNSQTVYKWKPRLPGQPGKA